MTNKEKVFTCYYQALAWQGHRKKELLEPAYKYAQEDQDDTLHTAMHFLKMLHSYKLIDASALDIENQNA